MRIAAILILLGIFLGCSRANDKAPAINAVTGKHPGGWVTEITGGLHPAAYVAGPSACFQCHGKNLGGGISGVSCFSSTLNGLSCHPAGPTDHPEGWSAPSAHGAGAKAVAAGRDGFVRCRICHGQDFAGGITGKSCLNAAGCHGSGVLAPHSRRPWRSDLGGRTHTDSDATNASACASCHTGGANSSRSPAAAPDAGAAPGCFNNTLCHGVEGHRANWAIPSAHGVAARSFASGDKGFRSCTFCHGANFDGGPAEQSCMSTAGCHNVNAPHPPQPWRSNTGLSHTACDTSNADQCAKCHAGGANSTIQPRSGAPAGLTGCFNNTLCHGLLGHPADWRNPALHGAEAKKAPTSSTGFASCQLCHGSSFVNGAAVTCFKGIGCHGFGVNAPHPAKPWFSDAGGLRHTTTDIANVGICAICHTAGANSTIKPPFPATLTIAGCFNNTLCHFHQIPFAPSASIPPTLHGGEAKKDLTICQSCHGAKGSTSFEGVTLANGTKTTACSSCHIHAKAHPTDWQGSGIYSHRTAGNRADACALCHDVSQGASSPLPAAPSCYSASFTNSLGQTRNCHPGGAGSAPHGVPYNNHNATARSNFSYCLGCHQIAANTSPPGCQNCHLASPQANPVNCISCHSSPPNGTAYPNTGSSHASHNSLNVSNLCAECHSGLGLGTVDHLNRARLRSAAIQANPVAFGTLAKTGGLSPNYSVAGTCLNTYCHGASLTGGSNKSPQWGQVGYLQGCGTCHGFPPASPSHANVTSSTLCSGCHAHVNSSNNGFTASGLALHINGILEALGGHGGAPYFDHNAAASSSCLKSNSGCHNAGSGAILYPLIKDAATGAPDCRSCHTLADPLLVGNGLGNCRSCHGTGGTGTLAAPTGTVWPNIRGSNGSARHPSHEGSVCGDCHPGVGATGRATTGAAGSGAGVNHGPNKNRLLGTTQTNSAQTVTGITPNAARGTGSSCNHSNLPNNNCHDGPGIRTWTAP